MTRQIRPPLTSTPASGSVAIMLAPTTHPPTTGLRRAPSGPVHPSARNRHMGSMSMCVVGMSMPRMACCMATRSADVVERAM